MIFNSFNFIILFPFIFLLYYAIPAKYTKARNSYLLIVSYLLYLQWKPIYALILLGITLVTYYIALLITNNTQKKKRKTLISFGVILSLLPLTFFKYFNFINECISEGLSVIGLNFNLPGLN